MVGIGKGEGKTQIQVIGVIRCVLLLLLATLLLSGCAVRL